jgi:hypothetical protein
MVQGGRGETKILPDRSGISGKLLLVIEQAQL